MASGTIKFEKSASSGSYIEGKIEWSQRPYGKNSSHISANLYVRKGNTTTTLTIPTEGSWKHELRFDTGFLSSSITKSVLEDWVYIKSMGREVEHEPDGTKSLTISGSVTAPTETSLEGHTTKGSATVILDPIWQPTTIDSLTCSSNYLDGTITAMYTPKMDTLYNRRVVYVNVSGTLTEIRSADLGKKAASQQTSSINFSDEELSAIYAKVKETTKAKIRVTFQTYSDSNYTAKVGDDQYLEITLSIPTSVAPTVALSTTPVHLSTWIAAKNIYVAGLSGVTVKLTASPGEGAKEELTSATITYDGTAYDALTLNINQLKGSGEIGFSAKATDSRGRSTTVTESITVLPYSAPAVTSMQAERGTYNNEKWTATEDGRDVRVIFKTTLSLVSNGNVCNAVFKLDGSSITPNYGATTDLSSGASHTVYFLNIDGEASHTLMLTTTDSVGKTGAAALTIPTVHVTIEYRANGKGIAFGKTSERNAFECAWPAFFNDAVYITDKITCPNEYSLRDFNINCDWADKAGHDLLVRQKDGLTTGLGWSGSGDDGVSYETVLDVRPKHANFRGVITAPRGRFTATTDLSGNERNDVALRLGDEDGQHIDMDTNEIQAKSDPTTPGPLYLNLDGGDVYAKGFRIPEIQRGSVRITPTAANTPTSLQITFEKEFSGTPTVIATPYTSVPGTTVVGVGVNGSSKTGCTIWVTRTNTTETVVHWIAIY